MSEVIITLHDGDMPTLLDLLEEEVERLTELDTTDNATLLRARRLRMDSLRRIVDALLKRQKSP